MVWLILIVVLLACVFLPSLWVACKENPFPVILLQDRPAIGYRGQVHQVDDIVFLSEEMSVQAE